MSFKVFNTLARELQEVIPYEEGRVQLYTCGPTVYDYAHIGNFRAYMFEDLLKRYLLFRGFQVEHVMNLTDVDDKTIRASQEHGESLKDYTAKYVEAFFQDLDALGIVRADAYPAATDHIQEMIVLIQVLIDKGHAYASDDGSVYFNIASFDSYGALSRIDLSGMRPGARVAQDEYEKDNVADFALWKSWDEKDGDVAWDSPWGRGRPGWHIECSAMSMKHLGESFDIHCGGVDNMFPHHEDEIAQSEGATGKPFVKYWMHCAHLIVEGQKMSKSLGNFYTLRDLFEKGYEGREIRYVLLATHYRQSLNFTFSGLDGARSALGRVDEFILRLREYEGDAKPEMPAWAAEVEPRFTESLDDDLNISGALAALYDMITAGNKAMDEEAVTPSEAQAVLQLLESWDTVLGCLTPREEVAPEEVLQLVEQRQKARADKDWAEADRLRDAIQGAGWTVKDTPDGAKVKKI